MRKLLYLALLITPLCFSLEPKKDDLLRQYFLDSVVEHLQERYPKKMKRELKKIRKELDKYIDTHDILSNIKKEINDRVKLIGDIHGE